MQQYRRLFDVNEEGQPNERILYLLMGLSWAADLVVMVAGLFWGEELIIKATLLSSVFLVIPFGLLKTRHLLASGVLLVFIVLVNITLLATIGQGIHDISIIAYPTIIVIASLALDRTGFRISVFLTIVSVSWLVFGESSGLYVAKRPQTASWVDFLVIGTVLSVAVLAVSMLASTMRENLKLADREIAERKRIEEQLRYQGTHDVLTNIYNRAYYEEELARFERGREYPISIIIADVDGLKNVNDTLGHAAGDELLQQAANVLRSIFRAGDVLARVGGDEFAALLPDTDSESAKQIVSRIRERLLEHNTRHSDLPVQLSLGTATAEENNLIRTSILADQRMYADKSARKAR
jgi:diguanylate cyclase (GGDEF)-like protein